MFTCIPGRGRDGQQGEVVFREHRRSEPGPAGPAQSEGDASGGAEQQTAGGRADQFTVPEGSLGTPIHREA